MAAFNRPSEATYMIHESVKVDTQDNEDHTFCGIMFPVKCRDLLPVDHLSIRSLAVRGQLGPMTVWVSKEQDPNDTAISSFRLSPKHWQKLYEKVHPPSPTEYATLDLDEPILLKPGQIRAIYIHSTLPGDQAIVYDNADAYMGHFGGFRHGRHQQMANIRRNPRHEDSMLQIHSGRAHVSNTVFGQMPIWGWGNAWRDHREFVGQLHYGAVYQLWNPNPTVFPKFGPQFKKAFLQLKLCQTRWESPVSKLPDECLYYILNMCRWDWFQDSSQTMHAQLKKQKMKEKQQRLLLKQRQEQERQEQEQRRQEERQEARDQREQEERRQLEQRAQQQEASACCGCAGRSSGSNNNSNDSDAESEYEDAQEELQEQDDDDNEDEDEDFHEEEEVHHMNLDLHDLAEAEEHIWHESEEDESEDEDDSEDEWEAANGYRAEVNVFRFTDPERDESDEEEEQDEAEANHQAWLRRQFQRIHVLRALARQQDEDEDVVDMNLAF